MAYNIGTHMPRELDIRLFNNLRIVKSDNLIAIDFLTYMLPRVAAGPFMSHCDCPISSNISFETFSN